MEVKAPVETLPLPAVDQLPPGIAVAPLLVQEDALETFQVKVDDPPLVTDAGLGVMLQLGLLTPQVVLFQPLGIGLYTPFTLANSRQLYV